MSQEKKSQDGEICCMNDVIEFESEQCKPSKKEFDHNITLQLYDGYGLPVPQTEFTITIKVVKDGKQITLQLPAIGFQIGPESGYGGSVPTNGPYPPIPPTPPGGYLYTSCGRLPPDVRPSDIIDRSWLAASDTGVLTGFSFVNDPSTYPTPPAGYIVKITNQGDLVVQSAGTFGNMIVPGNHTLLPTNVTYLAGCIGHIAKNLKLSHGQTKTIISTPRMFSDGVRDSHVNDAFDGVLAWAWTDNSMVANQARNIMNTMVCIGKVKDGCLKARKPIDLTHYGDLKISWDTSVAINRMNKKNIVVSWGLLDSTIHFAYTCRAVSYDGGKTWPVNGKTNIQPTGISTSGSGGFGDNPGVQCDKYGNFWYLSSNFYNSVGDLVNTPFLMISTDQGVNYTLVYTYPPPATPDDWYDFPEFCFGGDGLGNYGVHVTADSLNDISGDGGPVEVFIPITGLGVYGTPSLFNLLQFYNLVQTAVVTASEDGRVWLFGSLSGLGPGEAPAPCSGITSSRITFKSPGPINQNYAGPWDVSISNYLSDSIVYPTYKSQPVFGFFSCPRALFYDDKRHALYVISIGNTPYFSQSVSLYLSISRNNGQTWSKAINIANTEFASRGFQSMALDPCTGNLIFGFYDGRDDKSFESLGYYASYLPACILDQLVNEIPLSNPLYAIPAVETLSVQPAVTGVARYVNARLKSKRDFFQGILEGNTTATQ